MHDHKPEQQPEPTKKEEGRPIRVGDLMEYEGTVLRVSSFNIPKGLLCLTLHSEAEHGLQGVLTSGSKLDMLGARFQIVSVGNRFAHLEMMR